MKLPLLKPSRVTSAALASGLLLALAFPRPSLFPFAWFALVPVLVVGKKQPFRSGFLAGCAFYAILLYWLNIVMTTFGRLHPVLSAVAWLLLAAYLALYFGASTWLTWRLQEKLSFSPLWTFPVIWTGLDYLRGFFLTGFPWGALGYSQGSQVWLVQSADLTGVYGITALLAFSNIVLADTYQGWRERRGGSRTALGLLLALVSLNIVYGTWMLGQGDESGERGVTVSLVQGNIDQTVKWDPAWQNRTIERYLELSRQGVQQGAELVIWPESATPFYFQDGRELSERILAFAENQGAHVLFGSPAYQSASSGFSLLNSAYLVSDEGQVLGRSDKVHLVPFGEYVPLKRYLPFIKKLVVGVGDFTPGELVPLSQNGHQLGVLVCYEGIFPELSRDLVNQGADLLVNITNDAWYGRSSAPYQHLAMARMRAIENRVWLARAANTGVSALISPTGRVVAETPIFETLQVTARAGWGASASLFRRMGDVVPASALALAAIGFMATFVARRKGKEG